MKENAYLTVVPQPLSGDDATAHEVINDWMRTTWMMIGSPLTIESIPALRDQIVKAIRAERAMSGRRKEDERP